jgi:hypothetical protein
MDLVAMAQTVRRYKVATIPVMLLTAVLGFYVMFLTPPEYTASGSYILVNPPPAPTPQQIARDPALAKVNADNPLTSYGNLQVVGLMLAQRMGAHAMQQDLLHEGVDPLSTVANDTIYSNAPLLDITGVGTTPAAAAHSGIVEGRALVKLLNDMQSAMGVSPGYRVTAYPLAVPDQATLKSSSKLRNLIVVIVVGIILLFVAVSIAKAREERKLERAGAEGALGGIGVGPGVTAQGDLVAVGNGHHHSHQFPFREEDPERV